MTPIDARNVRTMLELDNNYSGLLKQNVSVSVSTHTTLWMYSSPVAGGIIGSKFSLIFPTAKAGSGYSPLPDMTLPNLSWLSNL